MNKAVAAVVLVVITVDPVGDLLDHDEPAVPVQHTHQQDTRDYGAEYGAAMIVAPSTSTRTPSGRSGVLHIGDIFRLASG